MMSTSTNIATNLFSDFPISCGGAAPKNPRKKRPKLLRPPPKPAAKMTPPCTECGRRFWSDKALFGHMRSHPGRKWRGITPPPTPDPTSFTEEDRDVAVCLLMLANAPPPPILMQLPKMMERSDKFYEAGYGLIH